MEYVWNIMATRESRYIFLEINLLNSILANYITGGRCWIAGSFQLKFKIFEETFLK